MVAPDDDVYRFTVGGEDFELPGFHKLKAGLVRQIRKLDEADALFFVLEKVCDERTLAVIDDMDMTELREVMQGWQKAAGVSLGESNSSST